MGATVVLFQRRYRSALLDYLLGNDETGRTRAYELGRRAIDDGLGLLQILTTHQKAIMTILESARTVEEGLTRLKASEEFLMDTLSPFEMTYRSFVASLESHHPRPLSGISRPRRARRRQVTR